MQLEELTRFCDHFLRIDDFKDYCPNGLQVEANDQVSKIVCGVTASQALIDAAIDAGADTLIVHHGYFWRGEPQAISGIKGRRVRSLIKNRVNLLAYHLPLDAHPEVGNNVQLAELMGWQIGDSFGEQGIVFDGRLGAGQDLQSFAKSIETRLSRPALAIDGGGGEIESIAWCTGAAQDFIEIAAARGVDAYVSGEVSEQTTHLARELGIHYVAAGHHATERYGVQALARVVSEHFGLPFEFIDIDNPV